MDDYIVTGKIGGGAQGSIFQVSRRDNGAVYALKVIYCSGQQQLNAAIKEVKCLVALRHTNIVSYEDFFLQLNVNELKFDLGANCSVDDSHDSIFSSLYVGKQAPGRLNESGGSSKEHNAEVGVCLIMELCSNGDLQGVIGTMREKFIDTGRHPLKEKTIIAWISQCASPLEYIHSKGFIHRDVKPLNVFFDAQGNVKLGDFGVAANVGLGCHSAVGTPDYLAPERMLQQVYDEKVDIWGLGMVALETITLGGNHPMNSRVLDNPSAVDMVVDLVVKMGFSSQLGELVKSMLQRHPADRPSASMVLKCLPQTNQAPIVQGPVLRPRSVNCTRSSVCSVCEVEQPALSCTECKEVCCYECDAVRHKHPSRSMHKRVKLRTAGRSADHLVDTATTFPLTPKKIVIPLPIKSSPRTIKVPEDCSTLSGAIALASTRSFKRISVSSGYVSRESLILTDALPSALSIVGESPPPVIEVKSGAFAVNFCSGSGCLTNFTIRHTGKRGDGYSELKNGKAPRPTAIRLSGGEWQLLNCSVSCREGSGMLITSDESNKGNPPSVTVTSCSFYDIKSAAVVFSDGSAGLLENNTFKRCGYAALVLKSGAKPKISHNVIEDCSEMGIICEDSEGVFEENKVSGNRGSGIVLKGNRAQPLLSKNHISENQAGILCADHSHPRIYENDISANQKAGILVRGGSNPTVKRNVIKNGVEAGVYIFDNGKGVFSDNQIFNNRNAGILVTTGGCPEVSQNNIFGNTEGVWVCNGGSGIFIKNELRSNTNGPKDIDEKCHVQWRDNLE